MQQNKKIILASQSPRRKQLLEQCGFSFEVLPAGTGELIPENIPVTEIPVAIAKNKAAALFHKLKEGYVIIAADTIVVLQGKILGKPANAEQAIEMLASLSAQTHTVITGVVIHTGKDEISFHESTEVNFMPLTESQIQYYVHHYKPYDKAGSYAIQEWIGLTGIKSINGDYYNVMGLPVSKLVKILFENEVITL